MMSLPAMTNQSASHRGIANQIDTTTRFCNAQVIKNMSGAGPLRNRSSLCEKSKNWSSHPNMLWLGTRSTHTYGLPSEFSHSLGRLGYEGVAAVRRAPPCVVSRVWFYVLYTSSKREWHASADQARQRLCRPPLGSGSSGDTPVRYGSEARYRVGEA